MALATVISISSDEDNDESTKNKNPRKKRKIVESESVICLDDDEDRGSESSKVIDNIIIQHDNECGTDSINNKASTIDRNVNQTNVANLNYSENSIEKNNGELIEIVNKSNRMELDKEQLVEDMEIQNDTVEMFKDCKEMQIFINLCLLQIQNEDTKNLFKSKLPLCKKLFNKAGIEYVQSESFRVLLEEKIVISKKSSMLAISSFNDIYQNLKSQTYNKNATGETSSKHKIIIGKLEHTYRKIQKIIEKLEMAEVDFDEEEDSSYIKLNRYKERAVKIYEKICKYKKEDLNANHTLYSRLNFSGSSYSEFNHAINKKFKNNSIFPTYYDIERCLKKTVKNKSMNMSESRLKEEARESFKNLGNLLQKRRKADLLNIHSQYLTTANDPAYENSELETKLKTNYKEANSKINEICEKYTKLQDAGEEPKLSSDSDDSNRESTDDEN